MIQTYPKTKNTMSPKMLFTEYPDLKECYVSGQEAFEHENDAKDYANHFNLSLRLVKREEVAGLPEVKKSDLRELLGDKVSEDGKLLEGWSETFVGNLKKSKKGKKEEPVSPEDSVTDEALEKEESEEAPEEEGSEETPEADSLVK